MRTTSLRLVDGLAAHAERGLDAVVLGRQHHRHPAAAHTRRAGGEAVDVGLLPVDAGGHRRRDEVGEPDPQHVAARRLGDAEQHDRADPRRLGVGETVHPEPAGDVGVDRRAADVLAALLDDQHVDHRERQRRHEVAGVVGERDLGVAADLVGGERAHGDDLTVG